MENQMAAPVPHTVAMEPVDPKPEAVKTHVAVEVMEGISLAVILILFAYLYAVVAGTVL